MGCLRSSHRCSLSICKEGRSMASNYATGNWVGATSRLTQVGTVCVETSGAVEVAFNISRSVVSYLSPSLRDPRGRGRCSSGLCSLFLLQPSPSSSPPRRPRQRRPVEAREERGGGERKVGRGGEGGGADGASARPRPPCHRTKLELLGAHRERKRRRRPTDGRGSGSSSMIL